MAEYARGMPLSSRVQMHMPAIHIFTIVAVAATSDLINEVHPLCKALLASDK